MSWSNSDTQSADESTSRAPLPPGLWIGLAVAGALLAAIVAASLWHDRTPPPPGRGNGKDALGLGQPDAWDLQPLAADSPPAGRGDLLGKVVLVNFWGTWCGPCRRELPELVDLYRRYAARDDFRFLAVSCPQGSSSDAEALRRETAEFLAEEGYAIPTYADPARATQKRLAALGAFNNSYPTTMLLDREGKIAAVWQGYSPQTTRAVEQTLRRLLDAK